MSRFRSTVFMAILLLFVGSFTVTAQEATPQFTPEATQSAPLELTEKYSTDDDLVSLNYPKDWALRTNWIGDQPGWRLSARMIRTPDLFSDGMERFLYRLEPGVVEIDVDVYDIKALEFSVRKPSPHITLEDVIRFRLFGLSATPLPQTTPTPTFDPAYVVRSPVQMFTLGNYDAACVDVTLGGDDVGTMMFAIENGLVVEVTLFTAPGESEQWKPTVLAIAESITYSG